MASNSTALLNALPGWLQTIVRQAYNVTHSHVADPVYGQGWDPHAPRSHAGSSRASSSQQLTTNAVETIILGKNPYPNVARQSRELSEARRLAERNGTPIWEPITDRAWTEHVVWSARPVTPPLTGYTFDYDQGYCGWFGWDTCRPDAYDRAFSLAFADSTIDLHNYCYMESHVIQHDFKNIYTAPIEVTIFQADPREDIPIDGKVITSFGDFTGVNPRMLVAFDNGGVMPFVTGEQFQSDMNWYDSNPMQVPYLTQLFNIKPVYNKKMAPGDELRIVTGITAPKRLSPFEFLATDEETSVVRAHWAKLKEGGPCFWMRVRGTIQHADQFDSETKLYTAKPKVNYGGFQLAVIARSTMMVRPAADPGPHLQALRGYNNNVNAPTTIQFLDSETTVANNPAQDEPMG